MKCFSSCDKRRTKKKFWFRRFEVWFLIGTRTSSFSFSRPLVWLWFELSLSTCYSLCSSQRPLYQLGWVLKLDNNSHPVGRVRGSRPFPPSPPLMRLVGFFFYPSDIKILASIGLLESYLALLKIKLLSCFLKQILDLLKKFDKYLIVRDRNSMFQDKPRHVFAAGRGS